MTTGKEVARALMTSFLDHGHHGDDDQPRKQRMPKAIYVDATVPVGRHGVLNADGKAVAVFKGRRSRGDNIEVKAAPIKRQIILKRGKDYSGKVGAKTQAKRDAYLAAHPEVKE